VAQKGNAMSALRVAKASEVELRTFLPPEPSALVRWCSHCGNDQPIKLPEHPSGIGTCTACGGLYDLCDTPLEFRRVHHACYREAAQPPQARVSTKPARNPNKAGRKA
jgi:hypothetical protein